MGSLLKELGFSLQQNQKMEQVGKESPDRNGQFKHINRTSLEHLNTGGSVVSIDCKKKENIGNFKNSGIEYMPSGSPAEVLDHDFPLPEKGKAVPYGFHLEMWVYVHGIATMLATSYLEIDEELISRVVTDGYEGMKARYLSLRGDEG